MIAGLIWFVIYAIVVGLVCWLLILLVDQVPLQPPFNQIIRTVIMVVGIIIILLLLLSLFGAVDMPRLRAPP